MDQLLIKRCLDDDRKALEEFYKILYKMLIGVCWRYSNNMEMAIEYMKLGFVRILLNLKKYKEQIPFELWAKRRMLNTIVNEYKKNKKWNEVAPYNEEHVETNL